MFDESIGRLAASAEVDQNSLGLMLKGSELLKANTVSEVKLPDYCDKHRVIYHCLDYAQA